MPIQKLEVVAIAFTNRCNLNCLHCGYEFLNRDHRGERPVDFFVDVLREAKTLGAHSVNITGGEIFLRKDSLELVRKAVQMGFFVSLESNGTLISGPDLDVLEKLKDKLRIAVSLDGFTKNVHEKIRGAGSFDRTMATLREISHRTIPSRINCVLQQSNQAEIPMIAKFAVEELGIGFRLLPFILEHGKAACTCKTDGIEYSRIKDLTEGFLYPFMRDHSGVPISIGLNMALVPMDIFSHQLCSWGLSMIGIGPSGIASLCHVTNHVNQFVFGDLTRTSLTEIWDENCLLKSFRNLNPDDLKGVCGNCLARSVCRGGCRFAAMNKYGDFLAPDPQCQLVYDLEQFPDYALETEHDCHYLP